MAIVAVCRLAILKRMPATPLTLLVAHRLREQVKAQSPEKWKDEDLGWFPNPKGEYTEFSNSILPKFYLSFWTTCAYKERFRHCFVTERKRQWEVREALKAINYRTPRGNTKIWAKAHTGRERQLCYLGEDSFLIYKFFDTCK